MIFTDNTIDTQIEDVIKKYPNLYVHKKDNRQIVLKGKILVNREENDFRVFHEYTIDIIIPIVSDELPYVIDSSRYIPVTYPHYYRNGKLCLDTDTSIKMRFINGFVISEWIFEYVEMYFFSYEYYKRYKQFPFGEREHGFKGILQTYQDKLQVNTYIQTVRLLSFIAENNYRGHILCPCGSQKKLRNCHGELIQPFFSEKALRNILLNDVNSKDFKELKKELER